MKYRLISKQTGEEHLCDKVTIDGFEYYVSDVKVTERFEGYLIDDEGFVRHGMSCEKSIESFNGNKVIATTNPNIDIPKVVDEVEKLAINSFGHKPSKDDNDILLSLGKGYIGGFKQGYNKSQETHPFSEEDMIDFAEFYFREEFNSTMQDCKSSKEILRLWKEQQPKIVYYA